VRRGTLRRTFGCALAIAGIAILSWAGFVTARADYVLREVSGALPARHEIGSSPGRGSTLGLLEVPRLGLSSVVVEGDDASSLLVAAGHLPDTPLPWEGGNSAVAAHRDADFRPLEGIRVGDVITFHTADAALEYVVRDTSIVEATDLSVLRPTSQPTLTLITCYPFTYIGPAPKRFIVRAERTAASRDIL
jgi:sortase A